MDDFSLQVDKSDYFDLRCIRNAQERRNNNCVHLSFECDNIEDAVYFWNKYTNRWPPAGYGTTLELSFERFKYRVSIRRYTHCE